MKRIDVDFNMVEEGRFVALTDYALAEGEPFVAFDAEGHELMAVVTAVEDGAAYFVELTLQPVPSGGHQHGASWTVVAPTSWTVTTTTVEHFHFEANEPVSADR